MNNNASPTFSFSTNTTSSHLSRSSLHKNPSTPPSLQTQLISLISIELYHLDTDEITQNFHQLFPHQTPDQSSYIKTLCQNISLVKKSTLSSITTFFKENEDKLSPNIPTYLDALTSLSSEIKNFIKNSKIKFKQISDEIQAFNLNLNSLSDYIKMEKMAFALEKMGKIDEIKNCFQYNIELLENSQKKLYDSYKFIMQKNKLDIYGTQSPNHLMLNPGNENNNNNSYSHSLGKVNSGRNAKNISKAKSFLLNYSSNHKCLKQNVKTNVNSSNNSIGKYQMKQYLNNKMKYSLNESNVSDGSLSIEKGKNVQHNLSPNINNVKNESNMNYFYTEGSFTRNESNGSVNVLKKKNKELQGQIDKLKKNLKNEIESKNALQQEISKLKQQVLITYSSNSTINNNKTIKSKSPLKATNVSIGSNNNTSTIQSNNTINSSNNLIPLSTLSSKVTKLIDMILNFTQSMTSLRDSISKRTPSILNDPKNDFTKLRQKLTQLSNDLIKAGDNINKYYENIENNLLSSCNNTSTQSNHSTLSQSSFQTSTPLPKINKKNENKFQKENETLKDTISSLNTEISSLQEEIKELKETNAQLNNKILTFRVENENIKEIPHSDDEYEKLLEENKQLKTQLINMNLNNDNNNVICDSPLQGLLISNEDNTKINELMNVITEQKKEIDSLLCENEIQKEKMFAQLKTQYENNINNIKSTFQDIIDNKDETIINLTESLEMLSKELNELKEMKAKIETDFRKEKMLYESKMNELKNEKERLEVKIQNKETERESNDDTNTNSNININILNKLKEEIDEKNKTIKELTTNHQNDLNELNTQIVLLKANISKLQEENISLSYSQRSLSN